MTWPCILHNGCDTVYGARTSFADPGCTAINRLIYSPADSARHQHPVCGAVIPDIIGHAAGSAPDIIRPPVCINVFSKLLPVCPPPLQLLCKYILRLHHFFLPYTRRYATGFRIFQYLEKIFRRPFYFSLRLRNLLFRVTGRTLT
jgi:hypothetical protein